MIMDGDMVQAAIAAAQAIIAFIVLFLKRKGK